MVEMVEMADMVPAISVFTTFWSSNLPFSMVFACICNILVLELFMLVFSCT